MSKSTLISFVPFPIEEWKPGLYPGNFNIKPAKNDIPECLVIGDSIYFVEIDENRTITVRNASDEVARAVVQDYLISNLSISLEEQIYPAFFWQEGEWNPIDVLTKLSDKVSFLLGKQREWFVRLVKMADDDWEKTRQHKTISDMQRFACKSLGLSRPWVIVPVKPGANKECIACRSLVHPEAIICPQCRAILNIEAWKKMQFAEVK